MRSSSVFQRDRRATQPFATHTEPGPRDSQHLVRVGTQECNGHLHPKTRSGTPIAYLLRGNEEQKRRKLCLTESA